MNFVKCSPVLSHKLNFSTVFLIDHNTNFMRRVLSGNISDVFIFALSTFGFIFLLSLPAYCALDDSPSGLKSADLANDDPKMAIPKLHIDELPAARKLSINDLIVAAVCEMPSGGTYKTNRVASSALQQATLLDDAGHLAIKSKFARPSFCSGATYLIFLKVLEELNRKSQLQFDDGILTRLPVKAQADGLGIWGRWNANGPGTARLFYELKMGRSFTSFSDARAGDFLKIFWNDHIGFKEHGHSVIYLGTSLGNQGEEMVNFWSSNQPDGFGYKTIPKSRIKRALFTRLENPKAINNIPELPSRDPYLASMLVRESSEAEMCKMIGVVP